MTEFNSWAFTCHVVAHLRTIPAAQAVYLEAVLWKAFAITYLDKQGPRTRKKKCMSGPASLKQPK